LGLSSQSFAFSVDDHTNITRKALEEFEECRPGAISALGKQTVQEEVILEDLNLARKWRHFSHFYHPYKTIEQRRYNSDYRLKLIERDIDILLKGPVLRE